MEDAEVKPLVSKWVLHVYLKSTGSLGGQGCNSCVQQKTVGSASISLFVNAVVMSLE